MGGEVQIAGIEDGFVAEAMAQDSGLEVVDEDGAGRAAKKLQRVLMAGEEVFHGFAAGELDIGHAAVAKDHDEKGEPAAGGSQSDGARAAPVHLCGFAGREGETEEGGMAHRAHGSHIVPQDAHAAGVSLLATQALIDLGGAVGMAFQPAGDGGLEGIELAGAFGMATAREGIERGVFGGGFRIDAQLAGDLVESQAALLMEEPDLAVGLIVGHLATSIIARKISPMERTSPTRGSGAWTEETAGLGSRLKT